MLGERPNIRFSAMYAAQVRSTHRTDAETAGIPLIHAHPATKLRAFRISRHLIDPANTFSDACRPYTEFPAWWSGFLFHILNPRQLSLYFYLSLLSSHSGICHPTTKQIRQDLGLSSLTIIFDAMSVLEQYGFILRKRRNIEELNSRRNVYQRPACEFTVLRLLEWSKIDGLLRPTPGFVNEMSDESRRLKEEWLRETLGVSYDAYEAAGDEAKRTVLIDFLKADLSARTR